MEKLLNFVEDPDVPLLDRVVEVAFGQSAPQERDTAQKLLVKLQEHPDMWQRVDTILEHSRSQHTKFLALQILDEAIKYRWKILPKDQCTAIKNYIVSLIIKSSQNEETFVKEKLFVGKLNVSLVQILKQEWPRNWESFIPEIVGSSSSSETVCENNMNILGLLSEEVFDFSNGQMTSKKIADLKESFKKEFGLIFKLGEQILEHSQKPSLILATLKTLLRFLSWIALGYIFETKVIETLIFKFLPVNMFRNVTLECLTEVASVNMGSEYDAHFAKLLFLTMTQLKNFCPLDTDFVALYNRNENYSDFIRDLSLFLTSYFKNHLAEAEQPNVQMLTLEAHLYLAKISLVPDNEIFKICLEYWNILLSDLYNETPSAVGAQMGWGSMNQQRPRRQLYSQILTKVRLAMIGRMAKPEEVLIVEDENGEYVREEMKDVDAILLYNTMREALVYLTHLDPEETQELMINRLDGLVEGKDWSCANLNTLCWAIGSISGALNEEDEKKFLVKVIKALLRLVDLKKGKDTKAVIASTIMYIVGQYPRFLRNRAHWRFLKTVVNKLFEFMHEPHPGVKDMACDTFLKIAQKCNRKFVVLQVGEGVPFIEEILTTLPAIISDLESAQIHTFYEAIGHMIASVPDQNIRNNLIQRLMDFPNQTWSEIMAQASRNVDYLRQTDTCKSLTNILKTNVRASSSIGQPFIAQLGRIFLDLLNVYKVHSESISQRVQTGGPNASALPIVRGMRAVKKETVRLLSTFVNHSTEPQLIYQSLIPPLLDVVLTDYKNIIPETRDPEVLALLTVIINTLKQFMIPDIPRILDAVFETTLGMITKNFEEYPDHRLHFFSLIRAINQHCFQTFFMLSQLHFKLVMDSVVWAMKHPTRNIGELGITILLEIWQNMTESEAAQPFYQAFLISIINDVFYVLTDTFHKSAFKLQVTILAQIFRAVESGAVKIPLWDPTKIQDPNMTNQAFLREYVTNLLHASLPNLSQNQIRAFVNGLFGLNTDIDTFKIHLRDFLIQLKQFSDDNSELYLEETEAKIAQTKETQRKKLMAIPGMIAPHQQQPGFDLDMS